MPWSTGFQSGWFSVMLAKEWGGKAVTNMLMLWTPAFTDWLLLVSFLLSFHTGHASKGTGQMHDDVFSVLVLEGPDSGYLLHCDPVGGPEWIFPLGGPQAYSREDNCLSKSECRPTHPWKGKPGKPAKPRPIRGLLAISAPFPGCPHSAASTLTEIGTLTRALSAEETPSSYLLLVVPALPH